MDEKPFANDFDVPRDINGEAMLVEVSFELQSEAVLAATICKCIHSADGEVGYVL